MYDFQETFLVKNGWQLQISTLYSPIKEMWRWHNLSVTFH